MVLSAQTQSFITAYTANMVKHGHILVCSYSFLCVYSMLISSIASFSELSIVLILNSWMLYIFDITVILWGKSISGGLTISYYCPYKTIAIRKPVFSFFAHMKHQRMCFFHPHAHVYPILVYKCYLPNHNLLTVGRLYVMTS